MMYSRRPIGDPPETRRCFLPAESRWVFGKIFQFISRSILPETRRGRLLASLRLFHHWRTRRYVCLPDCLFALSGWNVRGKNTKEPRHIGCKAQYCGTFFVSLNFIVLSNSGQVPEPTAAASRYPAPHGSVGLRTGPPERMRTWRLVLIKLWRISYPIPIRGADYAHHIILSPSKILKFRWPCRISWATKVVQTFVPNDDGCAVATLENTNRRSASLPADLQCWRKWNLLKLYVDFGYKSHPVRGGAALHSSSLEIGELLTSGFAAGIGGAPQPRRQGELW